MKKLLLSCLTAISMMVGGTFSAQADDVVLFQTDFSDAEWSGTTFSHGNSENLDVINGITFYSKSESKQFSLTDGVLTWPNNNMSEKYFLAIPVTGVNRKLTITVANGVTATRVKYAVKEGTIVEYSSISATETSSAAPTVATVSDLSATDYVVYIGRQGSGFTKITSIKITTPEDTGLAASDLAVTSATKALKVGDTWTLTKGVDYTTTSDGEMTLVADKAYISVEGTTVTAVAPGTANLTISQAATATKDEGSKTITVTVTRDNELVISEAKTWDFTTLTTSDNDGEMEGIYWDVTAGIIDDAAKARTPKDGSNTYEGVVGLKVNSATNTYFNIPDNVAGTVTVNFAKRYTEASAISLKLNGANEKTASGTWTVPAGTTKVALTRGSQNKEAAIQSITWTPISANVEITSAGYASFYDSKNAVELPAGVSAYVAYMGTDFVFEEAYAAGSVVPAGTAVVLAGTGTATLTYTTGGTAPAHNALQGSDAAATTEGSNCYFYALQEGAHGVGFYWMEDNGAAFENGAHKAYLTLPKTPSARSFYAFDDATSINAVSAEQTSGAAFNLAGQRTNAAKGLVIRNGKMMFVK